MRAGCCCCFYLLMKQLNVLNKTIQNKIVRVQDELLLHGNSPTLFFFIDLTVNSGFYCYWEQTTECFNGAV